MPKAFRPRACSLASVKAVYCTELVWRAWHAASAPGAAGVGRTLWRGREVIAIDDLQLAPALRLVGELDIALDVAGSKA